MSKTKTMKRRKVWVSSHADGGLGWQAYKTRKDAPTDGVAFIETRPGDVLLSREDVEELRAILRTRELHARRDGVNLDLALALLRGRR